MANYPVAQNKEKEKWGARKEGSQRISGYADTQKEAEQMAKKFCSGSGGGEVRIHGRDGKIRDSDTVAPGNDPCPPRDKKH